MLEGWEWWQLESAVLMEKLQKTREITGIESVDGGKYRETSYSTDLDLNRLREELAKLELDVAVTQALQDALHKHEYDERKLQTDLCDMLQDKQADNLLVKLVVDELKCNETQKHTIFDVLLFQYFKAADLDAVNFPKVMRMTVSYVVPEADCDEVMATAAELNLSGRIFKKGSLGYMNSLKFAKHFTGS